MDKKAISFLLLGLLLGVLTATAGFAWFVRGTRLTDGPADVQVLKLSHSLDQNHPVHKALEFMARRVDELSGGKLQVEIFPNGQLGNETEAIEQLQRGALAMAKVSAAPLESFLPEMAIFGVPFVFRDEDHYWKVLDGPIGDELLALGADKGVRGLCYYDAGARSFYTVNRPIHKPEDLEGLKIRVQKSRTAMDMVQALGGAPTPIPWGELYTALQQGMVDGAENNLPSFYSNRHFEACKYLSLDEHTRVPDILLVSSSVWSGLSPQARQWLQEAADESSVYQRKLWAEETEKDRQAILEEGVEIIEPDRQAFAEKVQPMHRSYDGTDLGKLMKRIEEIR